MTRRVTSGWWRYLFAGAAIAAFALAMATCGGDGAAPTTITTTVPGATTVSSTDGATATAATTPSDATLTAAIAAVGERYGFTAVVEIGGVVTTRVDGAIYDGTGQYVVTSGGTVVEYIVGPAGQWARQGDGAWTVLSAPAPVADPLTPLAHPSQITLVSTEGTSTVLDATYATSVLGLTGDGDIVVTILIVDGVITELRYRAPVGPDEAAVFTNIDTTAEVTPITVPTL